MIWQRSWNLLGGGRFSRAAFRDREWIFKILPSGHSSASFPMRCLSPRNRWPTLTTLTECVWDLEKVVEEGTNQFKRKTAWARSETAEAMPGRVIALVFAIQERRRRQASRPPKAIEIAELGFGTPVSSPARD